MNDEVNVFDYAKEIMEAVQTGVLLTTKVDDKRIGKGRLDHSQWVSASPA